MVSKIRTGAIRGVDGYIVDAEVDISPSMPQFEIVGLPDSSIKEARERIRTAVKNSGYAFPPGKITVNLAPAYMRKEGSSFDLPIACGILRCTGALPDEIEKTFVAGELSLDGKIRPVNGILSMTIAARDSGIKTVLVPVENAEEAALVREINAIPVGSIKDIAAHFHAREIPPVHVDIEALYNHSEKPDMDFSDVKGQENIKRALEVAASGRHNVIMIGPPGSGKTMMAKRLTGILPELSFEESLEVTKIYSVAGQLPKRSALITRLPFRAPHHTISYAALTGGGKFPMPGEISLAHKGVLFLDELPEFQKNSIEVLRQPLEDRSINIARVSGSIVYPSDFMLVAAMNPCPCGFYGEADKCKCHIGAIRKYLGKISGPLLDRIDIQVEAKKVDYGELSVPQTVERSVVIKKRIEKAVNIQRERYKNDGIRYNSELTPPLIEKYCTVDELSARLLAQAFDSLGMSARAYHKIMMLSRTIADLSEAKDIAMPHVAEAIQFRSLDRKYWQ